MSKQKTYDEDFLSALSNFTLTVNFIEKITKLVLKYKDDVRPF